MRCAYPLRSSRPSTPALEPVVTGRTPAMNYSFAEPLDLDDEHEVIRWVDQERDEPSNSHRYMLQTPYCSRISSLLMRSSGGGGPSFWYFSMRPGTRAGRRGRARRRPRTTSGGPSQAGGEVAVLASLLESGVQFAVVAPQHFGVGISGQNGADRSRSTGGPGHDLGTCVG